MKLEVKDVVYSGESEMTIRFNRPFDIGECVTMTRVIELIAAWDFKRQKIDIEKQKKMLNLLIKNNNN
jgi:hypothetical protein